MIINPPVSKKIKDVLKNNIKFSIFVHENPDCDALGAASALVESLKLAKKNAKIFGLNKDIVDKYGDIFNLSVEPIHLPYIENSVCIIVDTANKKRVLNFNDEFKFKTIIRIDHHIFVEKIGDIEWVDENASATCEIVGWLLLSNKLPINTNVINYLYAGLLTDTGKFMFPSVSQSTYELLAEFSSIGFDKQKIQDKLFINNLNSMKLDNKLRRMIKIDESGFAYIVVNKNKSIKLGANNLHDKVWLLSNIKEIKIWFYIYYNSDTNCWKGSLRSREYDINQIAKKYNGGGHLLASGFKLNNKNEIKDLIIDIKKVLNNEKI